MRSSADPAAAASDFTSCINWPGTEPAHRAGALHGGAQAKASLGDVSGAVEDFTDCIRLSGPDTDLLASTYFNRGLTRSSTDVQGPSRTTRSAISTAGAAAAIVARAQFNRAVLAERVGNLALSLADLNAVLAMEGVTRQMWFAALMTRGAHRRLGWGGARSDY